MILLGSRRRRAWSGPQRIGGGASRASAYPGRIGIVGGGWRRRPPRPTPVPFDGGALPTSGFEPMVRSSSVCMPNTTPATAPLSPSPTDADAAASDDDSGAPGGSGGTFPPVDPSGEAPAGPLDPAIVSPEPPGVPVALPVRLAIPPSEDVADRPVRRRPAPGDADDVDGAAPLPSDAGATSSPPAVEPACGPEPVSRPGPASSDGAGPESSGPRRLMATPLATSMTRDEAIASPTYAPRRCCSAMTMLPQTSKRTEPG